MKALALIGLFVLAQPAPESTSGLEPLPAEPGLPEVEVNCLGADEFGGTTAERGGWCLLRKSEFVSARSLANRALRENEQSFRAHYLMGTAVHLGDGNLPKALFHLRRAEELFIERYGLVPGGEGAMPAYERLLLELVYVHGEMDHHQEKIAYVDALQARLGADYSPLKAWPLLKLKRFDEARAVAMSAVNRPADNHSYWQAIGLTALCAIESEMRNRQAAYEACTAAAVPMRGSQIEGGVALSNAAAASIEMFHFDEAERYYNEATTRAIEGTINPWARLTHLYLRQGRFAEATAALRNMLKYRLARPAYFDQQDQADADLTGAAVLMIAGRMQDALRITNRVAERPDRQGTSSAASEQNEAGNLIMDRVARLDVARRLEEEASAAKFLDAIKLRAEAVKLRFEAWLRTKSAEKILANPERMLTSLRPECPGSIEVANWLDGEVVRIVGPGVALAAIDKSRKDETLPKDLSEPIFRAFEAEAHFLAGDHEVALEAAKFAVDHFPTSDVLVRSRSALIAAASAMKLHRYPEAIGYFEQVLVSDPGLIRRMGETLPVQFVAESSAPEVVRAIEFLKHSPRFLEEPFGFQIVVGSESLALNLADGSQLLTGRVTPGPKDDVDVVARRIAKSVHESLLVPQIDITQGDVRSLNGGPMGGGSASDHVKGILDEVLESPPKPTP